MLKRPEVEAAVRDFAEGPVAPAIGPVLRLGTVGRIHRPCTVFPIPTGHHHKGLPHVAHETIPDEENVRVVGEGTAQTLRGERGHATALGVEHGRHCFTL